MPIRQKSILIIILAVLGVSCVARRETPRLPAVVAFVNGNSIKEDFLKLRIDMVKFNYEEEVFKDPARFMDVKRDVLDEIIRNRVIADWGLREGMTLMPEELAQGIASLKKGYTDREFEITLEEKKIPYSLWSQMSEEKLLVQKVMRTALYEKIKIEPREIEAYYNNHRGEFSVDERVRVRQIVTDTAEKAQALHDRVLRGENFAKVAIMHSISPERSKGGDLGFFSRGTYPKEFDDACFRLKPGEISPVVKSSYGFHIFKMIDKKPKGTLELEEVLPRIETNLLQKKMAENYEPWLKQIYEKSQVQIIDQALEEMKP